MLNDLKEKISNRARVEQWLDKIGEKDKQIRDEVMELCKTNQQYLKSTIKMIDKYV
jgi:hypothetical protein